MHTYIYMHAHTYTYTYTCTHITVHILESRVDIASAEYQALNTINASAETISPQNCVIHFSHKKLISENI